MEIVVKATKAVKNIKEHLLESHFMKMIYEEDTLGPTTIHYGGNSVPNFHPSKTSTTRKREEEI